MNDGLIITTIDVSLTITRGIVVIAITSLIKLVTKIVSATFTGIAAYFYGLYRVL